MMKKYIVFILIALGSLSMVFGGTVSEVVKQAFEKKFSNAKKVNWDNEKEGKFEVSFELNKINMSAKFSKDGEWIETASEISITLLPDISIIDIDRKYSGCKIMSAYIIEHSTKGMYYKVLLKAGNKKPEMFYDEDGFPMTD